MGRADFSGSAHICIIQECLGSSPESSMPIAERWHLIIEIKIIEITLLHKNGFGYGHLYLKNYNINIYRVKMEAFL